MNQLPMSKKEIQIIRVMFGFCVIDIWLLFDYWYLEIGAFPPSAPFIQVVLQ